VKLKFFFLYCSLFCAFFINAQSPIAAISTTATPINGIFTVCVGQSVVFSNNSSLTLPNASYNWSFGAAAVPSSSLSTTNVSVIYSQPGSYTASLLVDNLNGSASSFASVTIQAIPLPVATLSLVNTGSGFSTVNIQGQVVFKQCSIADTATFIFDPVCSNCSNVQVNWGDGIVENVDFTGVDIAHDYPIGQFDLIITAFNNLGCQSVLNYSVFNGSSPVITVSGAGQNTCVPFPYPIDIISNGVPIQYTVSYSDGSSPLNFETANDTTILHSFLSSSCGAEYFIAPSLPPIQNAYSATILAQNICSANGFPTVFTIGPITISEGVDPQISMDPISPVCMNEEVTFSNASISGLNITSQGCDSTYQFYWKMQELVGFALVTGTMGGNNGFIGPLLNINQWAVGSDEITLSFDTPGTYHLWLFTGSPCGVDSVVKVFEIKPLSSVLVNPTEQTICSGNSINPINFQSVVPEYNIYWEVIESVDVQGIPANSGMGASPLTIDSWILTNNSSQTGYVDISATVGCTSVDPVIHRIWVDPQGNVVVDPTQQLICNGSATNIDISSNLNNVGFVWTVNAPITIIGESNGSGNSIQQVLSTSSLTYDTLLYHVTIENNVCPGQEADVEVVVQAPVVINTINDFVVCSNELVSAIDVQTNFTNAQITWQNDNTIIGLAASGSDDIPSWTSANNNSDSPWIANIIINAGLNNCPEDQESYNVQVQPIPTFDYSLAPPSGLGCDSPVSIVGSSNLPNVQVAWLGNGIISGQNSLTPVINQAGVFQVELTDPFAGCIAIDTVNILSPTQIQIQTVNAQNISCEGSQNGSIEVITSATSGEIVSYNWNPAVSTSNFADNLSPGLYQYDVVNIDGCSDNGQTTLSEPAILEVLLLDSASAQCGESNGFISINILGGTAPYQVNWSNSLSTGTQLSNIDEGSYNVVITDNQNCEASFSIDLNCIPFPDLLPFQFISPNGDGANDRWILLNLNEYEDAEVEVYNRWGTLVYVSRPYKNDWVGDCNTCIGNDLLPSATYFYKIIPHKKSKEILTGFIEIQP
jgi:large repetitive protein